MSSINKDKLLDKNSRLIIALDGPSASGKGHIGRDIASKYELKYFESSRVYRGLAYLCLQDNIKDSNIDAIIAISRKNILELCMGVDLFQEEIAQLASKLSVVPEIRDNLTKGLQKIISSNHRIIMEGRDIASVVAPEAHIKIFITADVKVRAERRYKQLIQEGKTADEKQILTSLIERDKRDMERKISPLKKVSGAIIVDTTKLSPDAVIKYIINNI